MANVPEYFGSDVFNESVMKERLPKATYKALKKTIDNGDPLDIEVANIVANAMKDWAVEKGCRLYDFRGVPGRVGEDHPLYGLYKFKLGFGGDYVEFVGEMDLVLNSFVNWFINTGKPIFMHWRHKLYMFRHKK